MKWVHQEERIYGTVSLTSLLTVTLRLLFGSTSTVPVIGRRKESVKIQGCGTRATQDGRQTSLHGGT
ncbi:MAG: hypothetical protein ACK55I_22755, partial [bacterium]